MITHGHSHVRTRTDVQSGKRIPSAKQRTRLLDATDDYRFEGQFSIYHVTVARSSGVFTFCKHVQFK